MRGRVELRGSQPMSTAAGAQINFRDLTPYLTYDRQHQNFDFSEVKIKNFKSVYFNKQ
jgi:hypothetical protein